jgi:hypothetical protein
MIVIVLMRRFEKYHPKYRNFLDNHYISFLLLSLYIYIVNRDRLRLTRCAMPNIDKGMNEEVFLGIEGKSFQLDDLECQVTVLESSSKTDSGLQNLIEWIDLQEST